MAWTNLSATASGAPPSPRDSHGFASAGGKLYVHGGEFCEASCGEAGAALGCRWWRSYCLCCCILSAPSSAASAIWYLPFSSLLVLPSVPSLVLHAPHNHLRPTLTCARARCGVRQSTSATCTPSTSAPGPGPTCPPPRPAPRRPAGRSTASRRRGGSCTCTGASSAILTAVRRRDPQGCRECASASRRRTPAAPAAQADLCHTPAASNAAYA